MIKMFKFYKINELNDIFSNQRKATFGFNGENHIVNKNYIGCNMCIDYIFEINKNENNSKFSIVDKNYIQFPFNENPFTFISDHIALSCDLKVNFDDENNENNINIKKNNTSFESIPDNIKNLL